MGQHWYSSAGTPEHFRGPNGSSTTLREARKFCLGPSVTEVLNILAKKQLEEWKRKQTLLAACRLSDDDRDKILHMAEMVENDEEPDDQVRAWFKTLWRKVEQEASRIAQEAAAEGTAIHAAVEAGFAGAAVPVRHRPHWQSVQRMLSDNFNGVTDWVSEKRVAHPAGFGGCSDLHSPSTGIVIDFKGSAIRSGQDKKLAYDQNEQLGAYQWGLGLRLSPCANIFLARDEPGYAVFHLWDENEVEMGISVFRLALQLWQLRKRYWPEGSRDFR